MKYNITPVPKPRMTQRDKWAKRPTVLKYYAYKDEIRLKVKEDVNGKHITFGLPMPKSWSKKKRAELDGQPHQQKPDIDNLAKGLFDALYDDDSAIWQVSLEKRWSVEGYICLTAASGRF